MARDVSSLRHARAGVRLPDLSRSELIRYIERLEKRLAYLTPEPTVCNGDLPGLHCAPGDHTPGCPYFNPERNR